MIVNVSQDNIKYAEGQTFSLNDFEKHNLL